MARLEKVKVDKIWGDEIFYTTNTITGVVVTAPDEVTFAAGATMSGTAQLAVTNCTITEDAGVVTATVEYMVQEELLVQVGATPGPLDFEVEYDYRFTRDYTFQKLALPEDVDIANLDCVVFRSSATVVLTNISLTEGGSTGTFDNNLYAMTKLKIIEAIQTFVALGTPPNVISATVTVE